MHLRHALLLVGLSACAKSPAPPPLDPTPPAEPHRFQRCTRLGEVEVSGTFDTEDLTEASGVVASALAEGVLWVHNDSGNAPRLYALSEDGRRLGTLLLEGVRNVDWEDLAAGPCPQGIESARCLYVGDIGDNDAVRPEVAIHVVPEPVVTGAFGTRRVQVARTVHFTWPEGPRDAEALAVTEEGTVVLVTKGREGYVSVYRMDLGDGPPAPEAVARLDPPIFGGSGPATDWVTAADFHPAGYLLLRTYTALWEFDVTAGLGPDLPRRPLERLPARLEPQGEAAAYRPTGGYVTVSEASGEITRVRCR